MHLNIMIILNGAIRFHQFLRIKNEPWYLTILSLITQILRNYIIDNMDVRSCTCNEQMSKERIHHRMQNSVDFHHAWLNLKNRSLRDNVLRIE